MEILNQLFQMQDIGYRDFQSKLIPSVAKERIIGVRTPDLRTFAKRLRGSAEAEAFLLSLPHFYYEENQLHAFLLEEIKDYTACIHALRTFLPYVDNWATCDMMSPKVLGRYPTELRHEINLWLTSPYPYTVRFAIGMLMRWYLDEKFTPDDLQTVASVRSEEYYVNMMVAWYFATALAKQYDATLPYLQTPHLPQWTHNKAIQKALESHRITPDQKQELRKLKSLPASIQKNTER